MKSKSIYALNLFNITSKREYLAYLKRSGEEVNTHNGKVYIWQSFEKLEDFRPFFRD